MDANTVGNKIKLLIRQQGLTMTSFARKHNLPLHMVANVANGRSARREPVSRIASALGVSVESLFDEVSQQQTTSFVGEGIFKEINEPAFNPEVYVIYLKEVIKILKNYNVELDKKQIDDYAYEVYKYSFIYNCSKEESKAFAEGVLHQSLRTSLWKRKSS